MRINRAVVTASWLALCVIAPVAIAAEPATPVVPKGPQLERLAEAEAMRDTWRQLSVEQKNAALDKAKKRLETNPPKAPRLSGNKEEDAIRGALKRIRTLPAGERDKARQDLRQCLDQVVPPPGAPQKRVTQPVLAEPVKQETSASVPAAVEPRQSPGCRQRKALAGCR